MAAENEREQGRRHHPFIATPHFRQQILPRPQRPILPVPVCAGQKRSHEEISSHHPHSSPLTRDVPSYKRKKIQETNNVLPLSSTISSLHFSPSPNGQSTTYTMITTIVTLGTIPSAPLNSNSPLSPTLTNLESSNSLTMDLSMLTPDQQVRFAKVNDLKTTTRFDLKAVAYMVMRGVSSGEIQKKLKMNRPALFRAKKTLLENNILTQEESVKNTHKSHYGEFRIQ